MRAVAVAEGVATMLWDHSTRFVIELRPARADTTRASMSTTSFAGNGLSNKGTLGQEAAVALSV